MKDGWFINTPEAANSCSLESIFKFYNLNINRHNPKSTCPFKSHKGGKEKSASFYFYNKTNSYWCFGCKNGSTPIDFVKNYEEISFLNAVDRILNIDKAKFVQLKQKPIDDLFEISLKFSDLVREKKDYKSMKIYDDFVSNYDLDDEGIIIVLKKLIKNMEG